MDTFSVLCPYCHERVEIFVEEDVHGSLVQDCEVCCRPWLLRLRRRRNGTAELQVERAQ